MECLLKVKNIYSFVDQLFEDINYYTIQASMQLAKEKGMYELFKNSDWDNGSYFTKRNYIQEKWKNLAKEVHEHGMRNAWLIAVCPY